MYYTACNFLINELHSFLVLLINPRRMHEGCVCVRVCVCVQGLYIILQMDWKCYIIMFAKILQSLRPEVYPEMSDSSASTFNMAV